MLSPRRPRISERCANPLIAQSIRGGAAATAAGFSAFSAPLCPGVGGFNDVRGTVNITSCAVFAQSDAMAV
jgi:hypothetical protein